MFARTSATLLSQRYCILYMSVLPTFLMLQMHMLLMQTCCFCHLSSQWFFKLILDDDADIGIHSFHYHNKTEKRIVNDHIYPLRLTN